MISFWYSTASQLSLVLFVLLAILSRKQLSKKATYLISRTLHVRLLHANALSKSLVHTPRYTSVIDIQSSIMKTRRRYRRANINGLMGKAT